jgi:hypothetical protein
MRKTLLLLLFILTFGTNVFAQTTFPALTSKNFTWEEKEQEKTFDVSFLPSLKNTEIPPERLRSIIMNAVIKSKYKLKNRLSFRPIEVMIYDGKEDFVVYVKYAGKNAYGADNISESYFSFKNEGEGVITEMFSK